MNKKTSVNLISASLLLGAALAAPAQSAFYQAVTSLHPAAYWPMQETVPPAMADVETNLGSLGQVANAFYSSTNVFKGFFPATSDGVTADEFLSSSNGSFLAVPLTSPQVSVPGPFSVETWVYPTNTSDLITIMAQTGPIGTGGLNGGPNSAGWSLNQNFLPYLGTTPNDANSLVGWSLHVYNGVGSTGGAEGDATYTFSLNTWYHIVGVYDGTNCTVYVNGVNATSYQIPMTGSYVQDTWDPLTIGCGRELNNNRFGGALNEVAIYTNALSATQIANHYNAQYSGSYSTTILGDNPLMYWRLDAPVYTPPAASADPVAGNYGSDANASGLYLPGTVPGAAGPNYPGLGNQTNAVAFNGMGTDATNSIQIFTNGVPSVVGAADTGIVITNIDSALNLTNQDITAAVWFKANPADDRFQGLIGRGNSSWRLSLDGTAGKVHWNPGPGGELTSSRLYNDGQWHFAVGVYANGGSAATGTNYLYVDGELDTTTTFTNSASFSSLPLLLGGAPDYTENGNGAAGYNQRFFAGSLAHLAYFTNALTGPQVATLYTNATLAPVPPPFIYGQPVTGRTVAGGAGTYIYVGVNAGGTGISYQWYYNSVSNYAGATALVNGAKYAFANTLQVTVTNLAATDSGYYFVIVTNNYGSVTSILATLTVQTTPSIASQTPSGAFSLFPNQSYSLSVTPAGAAPFTYQWLTNGVADITAGTAATYSLSSVQTTMSGETFQCIVGNAYGTVTNTLATLTVTPYPASLTGSSYGSAMLALSPTAYWPMHENAPSAQAEVETNYGSLGALGNAYYSDWAGPIVTHQVPGAIAGDPDPALTFYNTNTDCLIVPHNSPLTTIREPYTLEAWVKPFADNTDGTSYQVIMGQGIVKGLNQVASTVGGFALQYSGTPETFSLVILNGATSYEQKTAAIYPPGVWYHLAVTYVGTNVTYYINGSAVGFGPAAAGSLTTMNPDSWDPLTIGAGRWTTTGSSQPFIGSMDEVAIYTNILSPTQIQNHYNAGTGAGNYKQTILADNPLLYYRMDAPAYTAPPVSTWPVLTNYGTVALNGVYHPGAVPGGAMGPSESGIPFTGLTGTNAMQGNGVCSFADAGIAPLLDPVNYTSFSYSAWFKGNPSDVRSYNCVMAANDDTWRAQINSSGGVPQIHGNADVTPTNTVNDGNWHQFVMTAQANASAGNYSNNLYIDGILIKSSINTGTNNPGVVPAEVLIGDEANNTNSELSGAGRSYAGAICEAAFFYGAVLNSNQVRSLYNSAGVPPFITQQPVLVATNNQGTGYTNMVVAGGGTPLNYQWYQNGVPLAGQTGPSLTFNPVATGNAGNYVVVVTNTSGSVTSSVASLVVFSSPVITGAFPITYTNLYTLYAGANPAFSVVANGAVPIYYRWYTNGVLDTAVNNTSPSFTATNVPAGTLSTYCVVSNFVGSTTGTVWTASVLAAPAAPFPQAILADDPAGYWRLDDTNEDGVDNGNGDNGYVCHDYISGDDGIYTNAFLGQMSYNASSDPTESSTYFSYLTGANSDANSIQGLDFTTPANSNAEFSVSAWVYGLGANGNAGIVTKGYFYGEELDLDCGGPSDAYRFEVRGANGTAYNANSTVLPSDRTWHLLVGVCDEANSVVSLYVDGQLDGTAAIPPLSGITNSATVPILIGARATSATSGANNQFPGYVDDVAIFKYALSSAQVANLYVAAGGVAPYFTQIPAASYNVNGGATLVVPATVAGSPPTGYYWTDQNAGTNVAAGMTNSSQLNASLTVSNVPGSWNGDTLVLTVTNAYGYTNYPVSLVVNTNPPQITENLPAEVPVTSGKTYLYSIAVTGSLPLAYQWYDNGSPVAGQTNSSYSLVAPTGGNYSVVITNYLGATTSLVSTLTVVAQLTNAYATNVLGYGPAGYWPLQETNAPAAATIETNYGSLSAVGNAYYAITNATNITFDLPGVLANDSAVGLTGQNGAVTPTFAFVPRIDPALTLQPPLTLECWINATGTQFGDLIGEGGSGLNSPSGGGNAGGLRLSYGGTLQLYVFTGAGVTRPDIGTPNNMTFNVWHHCVATYDGTNAILYVDGQNQASGPLSMALDTWTPLTIGAGFWQGTGPIRGFDGTEAQVAIYTNVLSPQQVENDYLAGTTPGSNYVQTVMDNDPLLYYHMDAQGFTNTPASLCPVAVNYGSAAPNGAYLSGTRPGYVPGPANKAHTNEVALPVNGYTACVDAGFDPSFNPTGTQSFSAMLWFKGNPGDGRLQTLMSHGTNWTLNLDGTSGYVDWTTAGTVISTNILNDGNWHLAVGVHTSAANYLYVDGQLNASAAATGSLFSDLGDDLYLGGNANDVLIVNNQQYFAGSLAEAAFYTNALTAAQIQQIYTAAAGVSAPPSVSIQHAGGNVVITYSGTLTSATNVGGPYLPVSGASSPYTTPATNAQVYYRTQQ